MSDPAPAVVSGKRVTALSENWTGTQNSECSAAAMSFISKMLGEIQAMLVMVGELPAANDVEQAGDSMLQFVGRHQTKQVPGIACSSLSWLGSCCTGMGVI